jgi:hypothetical protein
VCICKEKKESAFVTSFELEQESQGEEEEETNKHTQKKKSISLPYDFL